MLPIITLVGTLNRIETKYTQSGKQITSFTVECSEKNSKGEWENLYLKGECWEKQAEFVNNYFKDGSPAIVTGKLYTNIYTKSDGSKVYENKLMFPSVSFVPKDKSDGSQSAPAPKQQPSQSPAPQANHAPMPDIDMDSSEIPF